MTDAMMSLRALAETSADADGLHAMIGSAAQRLMEPEVAGLTGAAHGEKNPERLAQRHRYRDRDWQMRAGKVALRIPKLRTVSYFPELPGATPRDRKGAGRGDPGGLHPGHLNSRGR
ncbi:transposase [Methylobacterium sp. DB0501]|uniref:transposase n=1 Tax=Methylobacterium sp. DB0501 TaxID=2709665 RepID=UPI002484B736|nr:transposase [Methylobacterium sp. DB0501]